MSDTTKTRRLRFGLRQLFLLMTMLAVVAAVTTRSWYRTQARLEYCANAGAVDGHVRTMQGYAWSGHPRTLSGWLFGDRRVTAITLYPGTYSDEDLAELRNLFPEATISDYEDSR